MFASALLALLPLLGMASAAPAKRASAPFGRLHPYSDLFACVGANDANIGAAAALHPCRPSDDVDSNLELWNITTSAPFENQYISLQAFPGFCLDGGYVPAVGTKFSLQACGSNDAGQLWSYTQNGYLSLPNGLCMRKLGDLSELDAAECQSTTKDTIFFPS
ncbi:hypothetical protein IAT38_003899 [Cryptococcus sp. DSM 104549]